MDFTRNFIYNFFGEMYDYGKVIMRPLPMFIEVEVPPSKY